MAVSEICEIVDRCISSGGESAWSRFVDQFDADLRRGIRRVVSRGRSCGSGWSEEDLLQECYCKLLERGARSLRRCRGRDERAIRAYLRRIAEHVARDALRARSASKRGRRWRVEPQDEYQERLGERVAALEPSIEHKLIQDEERRVLMAACYRAVAGPTAERNFQILTLAFFGGLTTVEICERLGRVLAPGSIDAVISRARKKLASEGVQLASRRGASAV